MIFSVKAIQHFNSFFIFAKLCVANTCISFGQVSGFSSAEIVCYFQETDKTDAVTVQCLFVSILFKVFLSFEKSRLRFFFTRFSIEVLVHDKTCYNDNHSNNTADDCVFVLDKKCFRLCQCIFYVQMFVLILLFCHFYMILFVIIHSLIFRLAKVVFLYLQTKFRGIFFCFTPENHENLATFVNKLTCTQ